MTTEVILRKDIVGLGEEGDIKKVAAGYARNYLIPFGHAAIKTDGNLKKLEAERDKINKRKQEKLDASKSILEKLNAVELTYVENAAENGRLFGSINQGDILVKMKELDFSLDKKQIYLQDAIKSVGTYYVDIKLYGDLVAKIKVMVKSTEAEAEAKEAEAAPAEEAKVEVTEKEE